MASNLFQLSHNFLTHKCPSLSTMRHLFRHTEILWLICNDCLRPIRIFFRPCLFLCSWTFAKIMSPDQNLLTRTPLIIICVSDYFTSSKSTIIHYQCVSTGCCFYVARIKISIDNQYVTKSMQGYDILPEQPKEKT